MSLSILEVLLWSFGVAGTVVGIATARRGMTAVRRPPAGAVMYSRPQPREIDPDQLALLAERVSANDPFRVSHHPPSVAFGAEASSALTSAGEPPHPKLLLDGIVGPPWAGLVEGIPGRDGATLVRSGERYGPLKVMKVSRDGIVVQGLDTLWRLPVRRAWQ